MFKKYNNIKNKKDELKVDTVIIGAGIFGIYSALFLAKKGQSVIILEKENSILKRGSKINQARVHNGYHYPRSIKTAKKASRYYQRFCNDFYFSLVKPSKQVYAIACKNSRTSTANYVNFCKKLNLPIKEIDPALYFNYGSVDSAFEVEESVFDIKKIKEFLIEKINSTPNIKVFYKTFTIKSEVHKSQYILHLNNFNKKILSNNVINATYVNLNEINKIFQFPELKLDYKLSELMICDIRGLEKNTGITVMDGLFFSLMPYGNSKNYTLSSVEHTNIETSSKAPQDKKIKYFQKQNLTKTKIPTWVKSEALAKEYLKPHINYKYKGSIFEIKPILHGSRFNDSRPTVIKIHRKNPYFISVLAGKISTIYDLDKSLKQLL